MNKLKIWNILENKTDNKITRVFNNAMILIISLNIIAFILETEKDFYDTIFVVHKHITYYINNFPFSHI